MKLLLTSCGILNTSIHDALVDLLGKPIGESTALCIPTGVQPFPGGPSDVDRFITGRRLPLRPGLEVPGGAGAHRAADIKKEFWVPRGRGGRRAARLGRQPAVPPYWMRQSGLADLLPSLRPEAVYVGVSGGAMVATPTSEADLRRQRPPWQRRGAGAGRLLALSAPRARGHAGHDAGQHRKVGRRARCLRTRSTTRPPSRWSTAPSTSSPRASGSC